MAPEPLAWITGAGGLIGQHLLQAAPTHAPGWRVLGLTRPELDLADFAAVTRRFQSHRPQLIIHCAALSRSPVCEAQPDLARRLNVDLTAHLATLAAEIPFVFFSSDLVFDGTRGAYTESDPTHPLSVYGTTKRDAETLVLTNPHHTVLRTSLNGGASPTGDRAFNEELRNAWRAGRTLQLFTDEYRAPLPARLTARAVWELVRARAAGLFHLAGAQRLSRFEIGALIARRCPELQPRFQPSSRLSYVGPPRPADTSLDCRKVQPLLSFPLPALTEWLDTHPNEPF